MQLLRDQPTTVRFAIIGVIVLAMLIPLAMVEGVTEERQGYFDETFQAIASAWGNEQSIAGPFLIVPEVHRFQVKDDDGDLVWRTRHRERVYLPTELNLDIQIDHQMRRRAIYEVPVYLATVKFNGIFPALDPQLLNRTDVEVQLDLARIAVGISHTQAINAASTLQFGDAESAFTAGTTQGWIGTGVHAAARGVSNTNPTAFAFDLEIKGTHQLGFTPVGNTTEVQMMSTWPHPSFNGTYLPERYEVRDNGFTAKWTVHELARDLPGSWRVDQKQVELGRSFARVSLFQPVTDYRVIDRAIKYGFLFIALTFLGFVCFELTTPIRFHPVQYGVVGAGLVLFYLALLSLSEHIDFGFAYLIATALITVLISWYVWAMTTIWQLSAWMAVVVASLYTTLYVLLQLEDFSLLVGTAVLFAGLIALMFTTRSLTAADPGEPLAA